MIRLLCLLGCSLVAAAEWPQRPLLKAVEENSMMHRYLAKPVQESLLVDDMERDQGWTFSGTGALTYTAERAVDGRRSLRLSTVMRDEAVLKANRANGTFTGDQGGFTAARLSFAQPQDWSRFNRISLWVYIHPSVMRSVAFRLRVEWEGLANRTLVPNPSHFVQDLEPGKWHHVVWEIPDLPRTRITAFQVRQVHTGYTDEAQGPVVYDFDRLELQRVEAEPYEGWQVAPGRIAFNHVGYLPAEPKLAIAAATGDAEFQLEDASTGHVAATLPATTVVNARGRFAVLDFSAFSRPGRYRLRYGKAVERPFAIGDEVWFSTIEKVLNFYYGERCGFDVPGIHNVCHQDWRGTHDGVTKAINGGWHDAGDLSEGSHRTAMATYAMLRVYDQLKQRGLKPELQARVLEEARWGLEWLLKTRFGKGYRITWVLGRFYTDNRVGTSDDMLVPAEHSAMENFLFAAVAAHAAQSIGSQESLRAAVEDFQATLDARSDWSGAARDEAAFGALAATELYRATGRNAYAVEAARFAKLLLACQQQPFPAGVAITGYYYTSTERKQVTHDYHLSFEEAPELALQTLCQTFPDHADWIQWYGAALLHSEYFLSRGAAYAAPYSHLPNSVWPRREIEEMKTDGAREQYEAGTPLSDDYRLRTFPIWCDQTFHGNTAIQMSGTAALLASAMLRNRAQASQLAARQLDWVFGGNPFSQSLMYGEGYDFQPHFAYCLRDLVGSLPVGVDSRHGDMPHWSASNTATYKEIWVVPVSRLLLNLAYAAMPAHLAGDTTVPITLRETRTGAAQTLPAGKFARNLPPGEYTFPRNGAEQRLHLLPGGSYRLPAFDVQFSASGTTVTAKLAGTGRHKLELRLFNAGSAALTRTVTLHAGRPQVVTWKLRVMDGTKPWVAVLLTDDGQRYELFGQ